MGMPHMGHQSPGTRPEFPHIRIHLSPSASSDVFSLGKLRESTQGCPQLVQRASLRVFSTCSAKDNSRGRKGASRRRYFRIALRQSCLHFLLCVACCRNKLNLRHGAHGAISSTEERPKIYRLRGISVASKHDVALILTL